MVNSLTNQRKEIAEKLRETKEECNQRGYPWMVEDLIRALGFLSYEDADDQMFDRLADLIDPTCEMVEDNNHWASDFDYVCRACGEHFSTCDGPNYCPYCAARVVHQ